MSSLLPVQSLAPAAAVNESAPVNDIQQLAQSLDRTSLQSPAAPASETAPVVDIQQLAQLLDRIGISLSRMQEFFANPLVSKYGAYVERNYTVQNELEIIFSKKNIFEKIKKAQNYNQLKEAAISEGLYYLFKYMYMSLQVPVTFAEHKAHFPQQTLQSHGLNIESDTHTQGGNTKVSLELGGVAFARQQRIVQLFEELKPQSSYKTNKFQGAYWIFKKL